MRDRMRGREGPQGREGRQGAIGREGAAGAPGQRGEAGASTNGEVGARGPQGRVGGSGRSVVALFVVLVGYVNFGLWQGEHHACQRSNTSRAAVRIFASTAFEARTAAARIDLRKGDEATYAVDHGAAIRYARSIKTASALSCDRVFPEAN